MHAWMGKMEQLFNLQWHLHLPCPKPVPDLCKHLTYCTSASLNNLIFLKHKCYRYSIYLQWISLKSYQFWKIWVERKKYVVKIETYTYIKSLYCKILQRYDIESVVRFDILIVTAILRKSCWQFQHYVALLIGAFSSQHLNVLIKLSLCVYTQPSPFLMFLHNWNFKLAIW